MIRRVIVLLMLVIGMTGTLLAKEKQGPPSFVMRTAPIVDELVRAKDAFQRTGDVALYEKKLTELLEQNRRLLQVQEAELFNEAMVRQTILASANGGRVPEDELQYRINAARQLARKNGKLKITQHQIQELCASLSLIYTIKGVEAKAEEYRECSSEPD